MESQIQRIRDALRAYSVPGSSISKADCLAEIQRIVDAAQSCPGTEISDYDFHNGPNLGLEPAVPVSADPCPQCVPGGFCKTPTCGRLRTVPLSPDVHTDAVAVDMFAAAMKQKLAAARAQGRSGWEQCNPAVLSQMLRAHVEKGDPRDVANFCCFLWVLGHPITGAPAGAAQRAHENGYAEGLAAHHDSDVRDAALEGAAQVADKKARIGVMRSLEATYKADAAREIAEGIRALKTTALVAREA